MEIKTCGDIQRNLVILSYIFLPKSFQNLLRCSYGFGTTILDEYGESKRKTIGSEATFSSNLSSPSIIEYKLRLLVQNVSENLQKRGLVTNSIAIKYKTSEFQVHTKQKSIGQFIHSESDLLKPALQLLRQSYPMTIRLLGVRATKLVSKSRCLAMQLVSQAIILLAIC